MNRRNLLSLVLFGFISTQLLAVVRYVKPSVSSTAWQGKANVYTDLRLALTSAVDGDSIWVAAGVYKPTTGTDRSLRFDITKSVSLLGGFAGSETNASQRNSFANKVTLSGDIGVAGVKTDNSKNLIYCNTAGKTIFIDGFIIESGYNDTGSGAGISLFQSKFQVVSCLIRNNYSLRGGAIYISINSEVNILQCIFEKNTSGDYGGAAYVDYSKTSFKNCIFYNNVGANYDAIFDNGGAYTKVSNSIIWNDISTGHSIGQINRMTYSCMPGSYSGSNNISSDPQFIDANNGDYRLRENSPCINKGNNDSVPSFLTTDFAKNSRIQNTVVDMGAVEGGIRCASNNSPANSSTFAGNTNSVTLSWEWTNQIPSNITGYELQIWYNGIDTTTISNISSTTYNFTIPLNGKRYNWRVRGIDGSNYKNWSGKTSFTISHSQPFYVKKGSTGNGTSWGNAFGELSDALNVAIGSDEIWVSAGTYTPTNTTNRNISFEFAENIKILGGFAGTETTSDLRDWYKNKTILSGNIGNSAIDTDNSYNVLKCSASAQNSPRLDGCIIEKGYGGNGGGLYISSGNPIINNCVFQDNNASDGGGIYVNAGNPLIANSLFIKNKSSDDGGAIYGYTGYSKILNCTFYGNYAQWAGGAVNANSKVINCILWNNKAGKYSNNVYGATVLYSCIQDGYYGTGNISANPVFIDENAADYRLHSSSPCLNVGINDSIPTWLTKDYNNQSRILESKVDMGIYEGGIKTPVLLGPSNGNVFPPTTTQVNISWQWIGGTPSNIAGYELQLWIDKAADTLTVSNIAGTSYTYNLPGNGKLVNWRIRGLDGTSLKNWSPNYNFVSQRSHPLYVKAGAAGDGSSWANTFAGIQEALAVSIPGDSIWVAAGTYLPTNTTNRDISFELKPNVKLFGGFIGNETSFSSRNWNKNKTILSGNIGTLANNADNSYSVIKCLLTEVGNSTCLDGFIIERGYGSNQRYGGGLYISFGSPLISNCVFQDNYALSGGGAFISNGYPIFTNSIFIRNNCANYGGALYKSEGNSKIINCTLYGNSAQYTGGAVYGSFKIINSILWNNKSGNNLYNIDGAIVMNSCTQEIYSGTGNISANPMFIDSNTGDFRLNAASPCLNSGINDSIPAWLTKDYNKQSRILESKVDMGIYEGGIKTPVLLGPSNGNIFLPTTTQVNISWQWNGGTPSNITGYELQLWFDKAADTLTVSNISDTIYTYNLTENGKFINWRVRGLDGTSLKNWSPIYNFVSQRNHPLYVKAGAAGDGSSWANAFAGIQEALAISIPGDSIWVSAGTYYPTSTTNKNISFKIKNGVNILGGFTGTETDVKKRDWVKNKTILSGDIGIAGNITDNSYHVLVCDTDVLSTSRLDGFVIEKGNAAYEVGGGGLLVTFGKPVITNCIFKNNYSSGYQGSAILVNGGNPLLINSIITMNQTSSGYSTIYLNSGKINIVNSLIYNNNSTYGIFGNYNSPSSVKVINSIVWNNSTSSGAEIYSSTVSYSCIKNSYTGKANISSDPLFINPGIGDYRLNSLSPCIGVAAKDSIPGWLTTDFYNNPRTTGNTINMGVMEGRVETAFPIYPTEGALIKGQYFGTDVKLVWKKPSPSVSGLTDYSIQYWIENGDTTTINGITDTTRTITCSTAKKYFWRVAGNTGSGILDWSPIKSFIVSHEYPLHVKIGGTGNGETWATAFDNLQNALSAAVAGDEIWIAAGTYKPSTSDKAISFTVKDNVKLFGGFAGNESTLNDRRIWKNKVTLSGDIGVEDNLSDNSGIILICNGNNTIDGITVSKGGYVSGNYYYSHGIVINGVNVKVQNCIISDNIGSYGGGAQIYGSGAIFANVLFANNKSSNYGGAAYCYYPARFVNCTFANNKCQTYGGAIYGSSSIAASKVSNSIFWGNEAISYKNYYNNVSVVNSCIEKGTATNGNIILNPLFADTTAKNFRLMKNSPCINTGKNDSIPSWAMLDADGLPRVVEGNADMGAFETVYPKLSSPANETPFIPQGLILYQWKIEKSSYSDPFTATPYTFSIKVWNKDNPSDIFVNEQSDYLSWFSDTFSYNKSYLWIVSTNVGGNGYSSDTSSFYIGKGHPIFVKSGATGDGTSWEKAFGSVTDALNNATQGDQVWVAAGTYKPTTGTDRNSSFRLKPYVAMYGGFKGNESYLHMREHITNSTILSGDIGVAGDVTDNCYHVINNNYTVSNRLKGVLIDGFIIKDGNGGSNNGGGIINEYADIKIVNCIFKENKATKGGAIANIYSSPLIYNSLIHSNEATTSGGAIFDDSNSLPQIINTTISKNKATQGAATSGPADIANSILFGNIGTEVEGTPTITYSCIRNGFTGAGNTSYNPNFVDSAKLDFRLGKFSSCFNKGNNERLPNIAFADLWNHENRVFLSTVDIGAYELGFNEIGVVSVDTLTTDRDKKNVDIYAPIILKFDQPISKADTNVITTVPANPVKQFILSNDRKQATIMYTKPWTFDQKYTLNVPVTAFTFLGNNNIKMYNFGTTFTIRACVPGVLTLTSSQEQPCPYTKDTIFAKITGDYNKDYQWKFADKVRTSDNGKNLAIIKSFTKDSVGIYSCEVSDMCGNNVKSTINMEMKKNITVPEIVKKWDDVLLVDNSQNQFSNYLWYKNGFIFNQTSQFVTIKPVVGDFYLVKVKDSGSGCVVNSDTLKIKSTSTKSITLTPNPLKSYEPLKISFGENLEGGLVRLFDLNGRLLFSGEFKQSPEYILTKTQFSAGIYIVDVIINGEHNITKLIIE